MALKDPGQMKRGAGRFGVDPAQLTAEHLSRGRRANRPKSKSSQGLLFSEAKKPYAEAVGQTGAKGLVRGCGPHCPPVSRRNPARDEASGAPRALPY